MVDKSTVLNLSAALELRAFPAVTRWNRLEGRPRTHNFDRALRAEVRDALWMLTKQWQMGEFRGDDAGSPVLARICADFIKIDRFQAGTGAVEEFSLAEPLEAKVERRAIPWQAGQQKLSLDLRLLIGRRWLKMLRQSANEAGGLSTDYTQPYRDLYSIVEPNPDNEADAAVCAHAESWQQTSAAAGRAMDGFAFLEHLGDPAHKASDGIALGVVGDETLLTDLANRLQTWFNQLFYQPPAAGNDAWLPSKLEYQFGCSAPDGANNRVLRAEEYYQGHLDWYALERANQTRLDEDAVSGTLPERNVNTFIPVSIVFEGMPDNRWWAFEDRRTNFGEVKPDTPELGKLLLLEFGLVYANDWFVFPYTLPVGSITTVKGIALTNVFGERIWIEPAADQPQPEWQSWSLFQLTGSSRVASSLILLPTLTQVQESVPIEEIALIRDEMANLVWGIERRIPLPSGDGKAGAEAAREYRQQLERIIGPPPAPPPPKAPIRYRLMNTVPENWIPFIPVHRGGSVRETQLQRAALPRLLGPTPGDFQRVRPRTALLSEGLEAKPIRKHYYIDEEEVPRAGAVVSQSYQRTRWVGGKVFTWLGVRKQTGRGEGSSGLAFDQLIESQKI
ncbi:MAG TPA: hypothetical protein VF658_19320 [Pyrinomonadaceae bacterium]|jgi:hypothetical protein